jgi:cob(I)alamin adenosyltransferase
MKIYTRTGDKGDTGLFGGGRVSKANQRVEAYGSVDELNATLGLTIEAVVDEEIRGWLAGIQHDLFSFGASLATPGSEDGTARPEIPPLPERKIRAMEDWIDGATGEIPELKTFILPGGSKGATSLHFARTVCRRAERAVVSLNATETSHPAVLKYLNRLSDLLFTMARLENHRLGVSDIPWVKEEG